MYDYSPGGLVINGPGTYRQASFDLLHPGHVALNWGDEDGTALNIVLSFATDRVGTAIGPVDGFNPLGKMWVGIALHGCYAFGVFGGERELHWAYISEKLGIVSRSTAMKVAELLTGIRQMLVDHVEIVPV